MLGLPDGVTALLFDLDGVLTQTAKVHQAAWKEMFDAFLRERDGEGFQEFTKSRLRALRGRHAPLRRRAAVPGIARDRAGGGRSYVELGDRKNDAVQKKIREEGVEVYEGSRRYLEAARDAGLRRAVVSSCGEHRGGPERRPGWRR